MIVGGVIESVGGMYSTLCVRVLCTCTCGYLFPYMVMFIFMNIIMVLDTTHIWMANSTKYCAFSSTRNFCAYKYF